MAREVEEVLEVIAPLEEEHGGEHPGWVRQHLVQNGKIDGSTRGVWKLTDAGRARLSNSVGGIHDAGHQPIPSATQVLTLRDPSNRSRDEAKVRLLDELKQLNSTGLERFCMELLQQLGYRDMEVTERSADGGIDGHGVFRQGAVNIKSAFQAKKWENAPLADQRPTSFVERFREP